MRNPHPYHRTSPEDRLIRDRKIAEYRKLGWPQKVIAARLGVSKDVVSDAVVRILGEKGRWKRGGDRDQRLSFV